MPIRLTPVFLVMILFHITLLKELSQGPIYHNVTVPEGKACKDYWWSSLLYIQNYINPTETVRSLPVKLTKSVPFRIVEILTT